MLRRCLINGCITMQEMPEELFEIPIRNGYLTYDILCFLDNYFIIGAWDLENAQKRALSIIKNKRDQKRLLYVRLPHLTYELILNGNEFVFRHGQESITEFNQRADDVGRRIDNLLTETRLLNIRNFFDQKSTRPIETHTERRSSRIRRRTEQLL